jgi:hypothetical protein
MRLILSRKGFDTSCGGCPSPILPDGRMVSLPIPDGRSPIRYADIRWGAGDLGAVVADLTRGHVAPSHPAHLDPDLRREGLPRCPGWRPLFGQTGAAQGHLRRSGVGPGDLFLFFGLYREAARAEGRLRWAARAPQRHVLWGWLQVDAVLPLAQPDVAPGWARYHPHCSRPPEAADTLYVARERLALPGLAEGALRGAGVFAHLDRRLVLTAPDAARPTEWLLPHWFHPREGRPPLTYHADPARWARSAEGARLRAAPRGQEFVFDMEGVPEAVPWLGALLSGG